jgi:hypothetical protein
LKHLKKVLWILGLFLGFCLITAGFLWLYLPRVDFGTAEGRREAILNVAVSHLGAAEGTDGHKAIIDGYNGHEPLAQGYEVTYDDNWCAAFVSFCAIEADLTSIIPTECSCQRQIGLFQQLGTWQEADDYKPLPGDIIYYCRNNRDPVGDCTGWSDHVGIVVGTNGNRMKVIEGNYGDAVGYRYLKVDATIIRGYGTPDYSTLAQVSD